MRLWHDDDRHFASRAQLRGDISNALPLSGVHGAAVNHEQRSIAMRHRRPITIRLAG